MTDTEPRRAVTGDEVDADGFPDHGDLTYEIDALGTDELRAIRRLLQACPDAEAVDAALRIELEYREGRGGRE